MAKRGGNKKKKVELVFDPKKRRYVKNVCVLLNATQVLL